jgi:RNA polymerase sigma factor (sigma-70 family)
MDPDDHEGDPDLVDGLRAGDAAAFSAVYACFAAPIFGFLARLSGRHDVAEDLFQETWMRVSRHARTLRPDTNLRAWLYTVARNVARSHARWAVLDTAGIAALASWWYEQAPATPVAGSHEAAVAADGAIRLTRGLARLPAAGREILLLVTVEGLAVDEAARLLGLTSEAARQRLHRARTELKRWLPKEDD